MVHMHLLPFGVMWKVFYYLYSYLLVIVNFHINPLIMIILTVISLGIISVYAPAAIQKEAHSKCDLLNEKILCDYC